LLSLSLSHVSHLIYVLFLYNATSPSEIYTLSLHDALPISSRIQLRLAPRRTRSRGRNARGISHPGRGTGYLSQHRIPARAGCDIDRKSTRLNSSHRTISYAVFCLKKKKRKIKVIPFRYLTT